MVSAVLTMKAGGLVKYFLQQGQLLKLLRQAPTGDEVFKRLNHGGHVIQTRAPWYKACGFSY